MPILNLMRKMSFLEKPVEKAIITKLTDLLAPQDLRVINESHMHNVPKNSETHFKVVVVSDKFTGMPLLKRHRIINDALKYELQNGVHALAIEAKTPEQWAESSRIIDASPNCRGGFGK
ncbi:bolA-like protein DDB_G0274169 [Cylas formicarius]|uniref:bolA-like protein DDB_G0274169 n=1 Tax=Cylas formicarius TaxID=197179 RepID=UPI002958D070|nr:bolA-like protein DDB_G0274169 [Cylas formicarius]